MQKQDVKHTPRIVLKRNFLSRLLTRGVRTILFPVTFFYGILVFVWSIPFRLFEMYQRAKYPFLCDQAFSRLIVEEDPSIGLWDLYCYFRHQKMGRWNSFFTAWYLMLSEREKLSSKPLSYEGIPEHPVGWYRAPDRGVKNRAALFWARMIELFCRIFLFLPTRLSAGLRRFSRGMESSSTAIGGTVRFLRRRGGVLIPLMTLFLVGAAIGYYASLPLSLTVSVDGEKIGYVESYQELQEAVAESERSVSDAIGMSFKLPAGITYSVSRAFYPKYLSKTELSEIFSTYTDAYVRVGYALYVDDVLIAASPNEGTLRRLIADAEKLAQKSTQNEEIELLNDTRILYQNCPVDAFLSEEEMDSLLEKPVAASETGAEIPLSAYRPKTVALQKKLDAGEAYCYTVSDPLNASDHLEKSALIYGHAVVEEEVQALEFSTTYRESDTVYEGAQYVYQKGIMGEKLVSYTVYYSGETEHGREVLSEATMKEPVDQIVLIGTKPLPLLSEDAESATSGRIFISPVYGEISSFFGLRDMDDDGVLESGHSGIDIPATYGTPLYAAADGVVTEAGETGTTYGIAVCILHENGLSTYYAHLSKVTVKVGQRVSQNQMIGNIGTSGYVTGAHVHFEVRLPSKTQVDPVQYMIGY